MPADPQLLTDLRLELSQAALRPVYGVAAETHLVDSPGGGLPVADLGLVAGRENLGQAILLRLLIPRGELASLGHPEYGSRLHELIGRPNTRMSRNLARLYILESLRHEPRIEKVTSIRIEPVSGARDQVLVWLEVLPIGQGAPLAIGPFSLEL